MAARRGNQGNQSTHGSGFDRSTGRPVNDPAQRLWRHSGAQFVTIAVVSVLLIWERSLAAFRDWRTLGFASRHMESQSPAIGRRPDRSRQSRPGGGVWVAETHT